MNIQVDPTSSNLASAMFNSKIRPRAVVGYGVKIFHPSSQELRHQITWWFAIEYLSDDVFPYSLHYFPLDGDLAERLFRAFDKDGNGRIDCDEFLG